MTLNEWQKKFVNKKRPGMQGVYDTCDMEGRVLLRDVYIKGWRVMTLAPIGPDELFIDDQRS